MSDLDDANGLDPERLPQEVKDFYTNVRHEDYRLLVNVPRTFEALMHLSEEELAGISVLEHVGKAVDMDVASSHYIPREDEGVTASPAERTWTFIIH